MNWEKELERKKQKSAQKLEEYKIKATFRSEKRKFNSGLFHTKFFESTTKVVTWLVLLLCALSKVCDWIFYILSSQNLLGIDSTVYETFSNNAEGFCEKGLIVICLYFIRGYVDSVTEKAMESKSGTVMEKVEDVKETVNEVFRNGGEES